MIDARSALQQRLETLLEDYQAVNTQLAASNNAVERNRLERQAKQIAKEIAHVEEQIAAPNAAIAQHIDTPAYPQKPYGSITGDRPTGERLHEWRPHVSKLRDLPLDISKLVTQLVYLAIRHQLWDLRIFTDESDAQVLGHLINDLDGRQFATDGYPPLLKFAQILATFPRDSRLGEVSDSDRAALINWVAQGISIWDIKPEHFERGYSVGLAQIYNILEENDPALMIKILPVDEDSSDTSYRIETWLWLAKGLCVSLPVPESLRPPHRVDELARVMPLLRRRSIGPLSPSQQSRLTIEVFLPRRLLSQAVHSWPMRTDAELDDYDQAWIGARHRVVVRPLERYADDSGREARDLCTAKWGQYAKLYEQAIPHIVKVRNDGVLQDVKALTKQFQDENALCYVEACSLPDSVNQREMVLKRFIKNGLPFGLWLCQHLNIPHAIYDELEKLADSISIHELRETMRIKRMQADGAADPHIGLVTVLFYDDPTRHPPIPDALLRSR